MKFRSTDVSMEDYGKSHLNSDHNDDFDEVELKSLDKNDILFVDRMIIISFAVIIGLLPLLVRLKMTLFLSPSFTGYDALDSGFKGNVFTYYKFVFLIIFTAIPLLLFLYKTLISRFDLRKNYIHIPLFIFIISLLSSLMLSEFKYISLFGMYNRHEGTITYLCYAVLFFIAIHTSISTKQAKILIYSVFPVILVNSFLSIASFFGYDVLTENNMLRTVVLPPEIGNEGKLVDARLMSTLNNPNYVSGFAAMVSVLFFLLAAYRENWKEQLLFSMVSVCSFALLLSSLSSSGFVTLIIMLPILGVIFWKSGFKRKMSKPIIGVTFSFILVFAIFANHNPQVWNETFGLVMKKNPFQHGTSSNQLLNYPIVSLPELFFERVYAEELSKSKSKKEYKLPELPPRGTGVGTGRVYIWEHTWELIKKKPLFGYGMDTLAYTFPQNDIRKYSDFLGDPYSVVDKPHNMYLALGYGCGLVGLFAFLSLCSAHIIQMWRYVRKSTSVLLDRRILVISIFGGWLALLIQGLFNDMIIGIGPIFWIMFGVMISLMHHEKAEMKEEEM
ncbi:MAG: O-antigen ligase family protein [Ignavibacteriales bacterium]